MDIINLLTHEELLLNICLCFSKRSIKAATFELHESHCVRHIKLCSVCDEPIPLKEMEDHFKENHAPTPCDLCGSLIAPDELEEHQVS